MSGSVFSDTLQEITNTKLDELSKRRGAFEEARSDTLSSIHSKSDAVERLALLVDGVKKCFAIKLNKEGRVVMNQTKHRRLEAKLKNLDRFLAQARHDPSVSAKALGDWERSLLSYLDTQSLRYQYASLYGELVTEWLSKPGNEKKDKSTHHASDADDEEGETVETFEDVGSAAKLKSRADWESTVFEPANIDVDTLLRYLESLLGCGNSSEEGESRNQKYQALQRLRKRVEGFEASLSRPDQFNQSNLKWAIQGLLSSDLLGNEKRAVLKDFMESPPILSEIADVLNMRMSALESWTWGPAGVPVEQRRKISGVFSIHMHEDLLQAIFLQYIGLKWSVFFRSIFTTIRCTEGVSTPLNKDLPVLDKRRLEYYLGPIQSRRSLQRERQRIYNEDFFVAKLLKREDQTLEMVDGEVEAEYKSITTEPSPTKKRGLGLGQGGPMRHRKVPKSSRFLREPSSDEDEDDEERGFALFDDAEPVKVKSPMQLKQELLHLLSAEIAINTRLHGGLSSFHAVFKDWEILLPHETISTVLKFLGLSSTWLGFFTKYLQAPLRFAEIDNISQPPQVRRRGVPSSHLLSDVFGEAILFFLDLAVNQVTSGRPLWRLGDDLWFWSADQATAIKAWAAVEHFASVTGTSIDQQKSGSARVSCGNDDGSQADDALPQGEIRWGFLVLAPETGRFEIDQTMVDSHITELREQLNEKKHSVFAFIQTWNTYAATFFSSNFGKSANCFGRHHVDNMLETHKRIQGQIFSENGTDGIGSAASIVDYLKKTIAQRFNVADIPDGFFYFPFELGGLDLQSSFISLMQIRDSVLESHDSLFDAMFEEERDTYKRFKSRFDSGGIKVLRRDLDDPDWQPATQQERENFLSFDDWTRYREDFCIMINGPAPKDIFWVYERLMEQPTEQSVDLDTFSETSTSLARLTTNGRAITKEWSAMTPYWKWITAMYGPEIVERFGELSMVDAGLLPIGMVGLFREKRVTWKD